MAASFLLAANATDALDRGRRAAPGLLRDLAVLLDDETARRRFVLVEPAEQLGRHAPVRALRAVLIENVEEHEFVLGIRSRFLGHVRVPRLPPNVKPRVNAGLFRAQISDR